MEISSLARATDGAAKKTGEALRTNDIPEHREGRHHGTAETDQILGHRAFIQKLVCGLSAPSRSFRGCGALGIILSARERSATAVHWSQITLGVRALTASGFVGSHLRSFGNHGTGASLTESQRPRSSSWEPKAEEHD
jgi:hypothetical protein